MKFSLRSLLGFFVLIISSALLTVGASAATLGVGTVNVDLLRLRAEAGTDSAIITGASIQDTVVLLERCDDSWYKVSYKQYEGYMHSDYLDIAEAAELDLGTGVVSASVVNLRSGPSTEDSIVTTLNLGQSVQISGIDKEWFRVVSGDFVGYVHSDLLALPSAAGTASASGTAAALIEYSMQFLGTPYAYGGSSPSGFDCSGFVQYVFKNFDRPLNRTASDMLKNGSPISKSELQPGDLIFFKAGSAAASHVSIYIGNNQMIHSATGGVKITDLSTDYYTTYYSACRRVLS